MIDRESNGMTIDYYSNVLGTPRSLILIIVLSSRLHPQQ